jgi:hypothetical protein
MALDDDTDDDDPIRVSIEPALLARDASQDPPRAVERYHRGMSSEITTALCPYCLKHTSVTAAPLRTSGNAPIEVRDYAVYRPGAFMWIMVKCNACSSPMLYEMGTRRLVPPPGAHEVSRHVPEPMHSDLDEARVALSAGAFKAAVVMARRAIQSACIEQGAPRKRADGKRDLPLADQIDDVTRKGLITAKLRDLAHAVRFVGNDGAHPDEDEFVDELETVAVSREEAEAVEGLATSFLHFLYVMPAETEASLTRSGRTVHPLKQ